MNLSTLNELIDTIQSLLDGRATSAPPEAVAQEYCKKCREVNDRLSRIGLMLDEGGEIQALQLAEQQPRVLDVAIALSFGRETEWLEYCRSRGYEVAPMINARTLDVLQGIQAKGVAPNHPLYRDYRAAVSSKSDGKAFELIRVIHHLNPDDENAARELKRLRRKLLTEVLSWIREAHAAGDSESVLAAMPKAEECGDPEEYEHLPEWREALAIRHQQRSDEAQLRMPALLETAEEQLRSGDWRAAALAHGEFAQLAKTFGTAGQASDTNERAKGLEGQLVNHRAEASRIVKVDGLVAESLQLSKGVEARAASLGLDTEFATPLLVELALKAKQISDLHGEVPEASRVRIEAARAMLTRSIERARSARRRKKAAVIGMAATLVLAATGYGFALDLANRSTQAISELRAKQATAGLRDLLDRLDGKEAILLGFSSLSTPAAEARQWLAKVAADTLAADHEILLLEKAREAAFAGSSSSELQQKLEETEALVAKLPDDQRKVAEARVMIVRNDAIRDWKRRQTKADESALKTLERWTPVLEKVDYAASVEVAKDVIKGYGAVFAPLLPLAAQSDTREALLRLPPATATRVRDASDAFEEVGKHVAKVETALAALGQASNPDDYHTALTTLAGSRFKEAGLAKAALDAWPREEKVRAFLVFRNDLDALRNAKEEDLSKVPFPETATKEDRRVIGELTNCETLNDLWEVTWKKRSGLAETKPGPIETWLGKGALKANGPNWTGKVASPISRPAANLKFSEQTFGEINNVALISNRLLAVSEMMENLQLSSLLDDTGAEYRASVLPLVDRVTNSKGVSPLARAFVLARLFRLIRAREIAWGAHYCPELLDDMEKFAVIERKWPLGEGSWLAKDKPSYAQYWEQYFVEREHRSFYDNMKRMKAAVNLGIKNSITLAGRVGGTGDMKLDSSNVSRLLIGIAQLSSSESGMYIAGIAEGTAGAKFVSSAALVPYSPVLCIDMPANDQRFLQTLHASDLNQAPTTETP